MSRTRKSLLALLVAFVVFAMSMFVLTTFKANATADNSFYMNGAGVRYASNEDDDTGIRFEARVGGDLYDSVIADSNKIFGAFILPYDYLTNNDISSIVNHKEQFGATITYNECDNLIKYKDNEDGTKSIVYSITDIQYGNYNRDFFCLMYIKSLDSGKYDYADANSKNIRSVADVALAAYEDGDYDAEIVEQVETLFNYVFVAEYELTDTVRSFDGAKAYASENIDAVSSFNDKVATLHNNYAAKSTIEEIKTDYSGLSSAAKVIVADEYATVVEMEENLNGSDRVFGDSKLSSAFSKYTTTGDYVLYRAKIEHTVSSDYTAYVGQNGYVYNGVYGNIAKVNISQGTSGVDNIGTAVPEDNNWGLVVEFDEVLTAMNATGAPSVTLNVYINSSSNKWIQFGDAGITRIAQSKSRAPGWHEITFTKADIENLVANCTNTMIWNNNAEFTTENPSFEIWVSDFILIIPKTEEYVSAGDTQIKLSTIPKDTVVSGKGYSADVTFSVANDADHGRVVKAAISRDKDSATYGVNWAFSVDFDKVLEAMNATSAESAKLYVYLKTNASDEIDPWIGFGDNATRIHAGSKSVGWNEITFTKAEIQTLADLSIALIWNSNAFKGAGTSFEVWVSDFILNIPKTEEYVSAGNTQIKLSMHQKDIAVPNNAGSTYYYGADVIFSVANDDTYGRIVKAAISKGTTSNTSANANWGICVEFGKVLEAMNETGASSVTFSIYVNSTVGQWIGFGNHKDRIISGTYSVGWNEITLSKTQIEQLVNISPDAAMWNTNAFGSVESFELWVSDFILN